jgi:hypothetical protein
MGHHKSSGGGFRRIRCVQPRRYNRVLSGLDSPQSGVGRPDYVARHLFEPYLLVNMASPKVALTPHRETLQSSVSVDELL